jgi:hypothetical protein
MREAEQSLRRLSHKETTNMLDLPQPIAAFFTADVLVHGSKWSDP